MRRLIVFSFVMLVTLASCSSSEEAGSLDASGGSPSPGSMMGPMAPPPAASGEKPVVTSPGGTPPSTLQVKDITVGSGAEATAGTTVFVHYVGVSWSNGQQFDASWDRGQPFDFPLGAGRVIPGWDQGVAGMKVGGRRELIIPPDLAYGPQGSPPVIGPNETLIFVVDLLAVN